jgi:hypothetical protein
MLIVIPGAKNALQNQRQAVTYFGRMENSVATSLAQRVLDQLEDVHGMPCGGVDLPDDLALEDGETVEWILSSFIDNHLVNIFRCQASGSVEGVIATFHGDGGILASTAGPWSSAEEAKLAVGEAPEGWTALWRS